MTGRLNYKLILFYHQNKAYSCSVSHSNEGIEGVNTWWALVADNGLESHPLEQSARVAAPPAMAATPAAARGGAPQARPAAALTKV